MPGFPGPFKVGETVLVLFADAYYEAKVLKDSKKNGRRQLFVHYQGWKKKYDDWVDLSNVKKYDKSLLRSGTPNMEKPSGNGLGKEGLPQRKRRLGDFRKGEEPALPAAGEKLEISIPVELKKVLLEDNKAVVEEKRLVPLPRAPCVSDLLNEYVATASALASPEAALEMQGVMAGVEVYFDKALRDYLLYEPEHRQGIHQLKRGQRASSVYGAEHLLRLMVSLPNLVPCMTSEAATAAETYLPQFLTFLQDNADRFFLPSQLYVELGPAEAGSLEGIHAVS
eukprot:jgi/Botrbrau1/6010/Bobra.104_1s0037.1